MKRLLSIILVMVMILVSCPEVISAKTIEYMSAELSLNEMVDNKIVVFDDGRTKIEVEIISFKPSHVNYANTSPTSTNDYPYFTGTSNWSGTPPAGTYDLKIEQSDFAYTVSYYVNCTMNSGADNEIHYVYSPAVDGPLYEIEYTQFEVLRSKPTSETPASAILSWNANLRIVGQQVQSLNDFLKFEMNGSQYRIIWQI